MGSCFTRWKLHAALTGHYLQQQRRIQSNKIQMPHENRNMEVRQKTRVANQCNLSGGISPKRNGFSFRRHTPFPKLPLSFHFLRGGAACSKRSNSDGWQIGNTQFMTFVTDRKFDPPIYWLVLMSSMSRYLWSWRIIEWILSHLRLTQKMCLYLINNVSYF